VICLPIRHHIQYHIALLCLTGASAQSDFRRQRLITLVRETFPDVSQIHSRLQYFVHTNNDLSEQQQQQLSSLLDATPVASTQDGHAVWVSPRLGTISPWSSKATDILHSCGLHAILRVERAIEYGFVGLTSEQSQDARLHALLHDRMTETIDNEPPAPEAQ